MIRTLMTAAISAACLSTAHAGQNVPPAPPTEAYTATSVTVCNPVSLQIYFQNGESVLSEFSRSTLSATREGLSGCSIARVDLVAVTGDGRTTDEKAALASARSELVLNALAEEGLTSDTISTAYEMTPKAELIGHPAVRRVDITLAAYRPEIG
ncbi:MAG: hypothetical protein AAF768_02545 [Pseudomonadota bacterium]